MNAKSSADSKLQECMVFEDAPDGVMLADHDCNLLETNRMGHIMFGYSRDEILSMSIKDLIPPEQVPRLLSLRDSLIKSKGLDISVWTGIRKDRSSFPVEVSTKFLSDGRWQGCLRDLTNQKASRDRGQILAKVREAVRSREQILAFVSHDLKNPITAIKFSNQIIERTVDGLEVQPKVQKYTALISRSVNLALELIECLLDQSMMEHGSFTIRLAKNSAKRLIQDAAESYSTVASKNRISIKVKAHRTLPDFECDSERLSQVLANLIANAIKFSPIGGTIIVHCRRAGPNIEFCVSDKGQGISSEQLPNVFDQFWQAKDGGRLSVGLGLAIAKNIISAHRGRIWVESKVGLGSKFYFSIPIKSR